MYICSDIIHSHGAGLKQAELHGFQQKASDRLTTDYVLINIKINGILLHRETRIFRLYHLSFRNEDAYLT